MEESRKKMKILWCCLEAWAVACQTKKRQGCGRGSRALWAAHTGRNEENFKKLHKALFILFMIAYLYLWYCTHLHVCITISWWTLNLTGVLILPQIGILIEPMYWSTMCYFSHNLECQTWVISILIRLWMKPLRSWLVTLQRNPANLL